MGDRSISQRQFSTGMLATDLDGTLAVNGQISREDRAAAHRLRKAGIPLLIITGRNLRSLGRTPAIREVADVVLFSSGSGLLRAPDAMPEERHRLSGEDLRDISAILNSYGEDYCILDPVPMTHHFAWQRHRPAVQNPDFDARMAIYQEWARPLFSDSCSEGGCQVLIIRPPGLPVNPGLETALSRWSVFHSSSPIDHESMWLEVFPSGVDKGRALADWCREVGIPASEVMTLGNDFNDKSMLDWSGHPRVVGNAPADLRSSYATLPPAGQGGFEKAVEEALELFAGS